MFPELAKDFKINLSVTADCVIILENEKESLRISSNRWKNWEVV